MCICDHLNKITDLLTELRRYAIHTIRVCLRLLYQHVQEATSSQWNRGIKVGFTVVPCDFWVAVVGGHNVCGCSTA